MEEDGTSLSFSLGSWQDQVPWSVFQSKPELESQGDVVEIALDSESTVCTFYLSFATSASLLGLSFFIGKNQWIGPVVKLFCLDQSSVSADTLFNF